MGWGGVVWDGVSKVSFNFLYTLWVYRSCIYIVIYVVKNSPHNFFVDLKFGQVGGPNAKIQEHPLGRFF